VYEVKEERDGFLDLVAADEGIDPNGWSCSRFEIVERRPFRVGDRVKIVEDKSQPGHGSSIGKVGRIVIADPGAGFPYLVEYNEGCESIYCEADELELIEAAPTPDSPAAKDTTAIVARLSNAGRPMPAVSPQVHVSTDAAIVEAERLARENPGAVFAVYECAAISRADIPVAVTVRP
jgi:hypothetical protein